MTPDPVAEWHAGLLADIERLADPAYREGSLRVAPTAQRVHGVRTPDSRRLAREWRRANPATDDRLVLDLVEALWASESRDERMLGLEILCLHPQIVRDLTHDRFDRWRRAIDNWGVCDFVATRILGPWALSDPDDRLGYLERLVGDPQLYGRRLGLVACVPLNRDGSSFGEWTLAQVDRVIDERDPLMTKAVSWVLRQMTRHQAAEVRAYLEKRGERIAALARREVRNKLRTGRKSGRTG